jgi:hypothetical protein
VKGLAGKALSSCSWLLLIFVLDIAMSLQAKGSAFKGASASQNEPSIVANTPPFLSPPSSRHASRDQYRLHGLSTFSSEQQQLLREWIALGVKATRASLGIYPTPLELFVYPRKSNQPVPWAHTRRDELESIHFYVDTRYSLQDFQHDWTLYHEMAHLALPYLGEQYAWFSEGFASFMQYQLMANVDVLGLPLEEAYSKKISPHLRWFQTDINAAAIAANLMEKRQYPAAYWGSAWYFILAEQLLQSKHHTTLMAVIERYQQQNRATDDSMQDLMRSLDLLVEDKLFSQLLWRFEQQAARDLYPKTWPLMREQVSKD